MIIKTLKIKNFRSNIDSEINLSDLSLFVGLNDVGKSNILKALNLFFNEETDYGKKLDFANDYAINAKKGKKKAAEIRIEIVIIPPKNYKDSKEIIWAKSWRKTGLQEPDLQFADGSPFPPKSKLNAWLKNIRYVYIPAIRSSSYFELLLGQLHDSLAETVENELRKAGHEFIRNIKTNTVSLLTDLDQKLKLKSEIRLPTNLQSLFKTLDFSTKEGSFEISLSNRGDGIKTRHIPVILKFISDQLNSNKVKGSPNINMIWGYEEPENNLELLATFELAEEFRLYSKEIQLLISTHSPGFYALKEKHPSNTSVFFIKKEGPGNSQIIKVEKTTTLDKEMGLMPIITPYLIEKSDEIKKLATELEEQKKKIRTLHSDILFVEGSEEEIIYDWIFRNHFTAYPMAVKKDGLGCSGVRNQLMSWSWLAGINQYRAIGIFDNDNSGSSEYSKLENEKVYTTALSNGKVKAIKYRAPLHLRNIMGKLGNFPIELEEMYPVTVWQTAHQKGWLEPRPINQLQQFIKVDSLSQSLDQKLNQEGFTTDEKLYILQYVPDEHKRKLVKHIFSGSTSEVLSNLDPIILFLDSNLIPFLNRKKV